MLLSFATYDCFCRSQRRPLCMLLWFAIYDCYCRSQRMNVILKPVFHGACFGVVSAPTLYAPYPRRVWPYPARIRRVQSRRRNRSKTRSMENGLYGGAVWLTCFGRSCADGRSLLWNRSVWSWSVVPFR